MEFSVKANIEQWNAMLALMNEAVKSKGLEVALVAGFWDQKIKEAAENAAKAAAVEEPPIKNIKKPKSSKEPKLEIVDNNNENTA